MVSRFNIENNLNDAYNVAIYIRNVIKNNANVHICNEGHFQDGPNPFYNQMEEGLILEEYYGMPSRIYTKIGVWTITGSGSSSNNGWKEIIEILKKDLGLKMLKEGYQSNSGYNGPWWEITELNKEKLPLAKKQQHASYIDYNECKNIWNEFKSKHNFE